MSLVTLKQMRDNIASTVRETQVGSLIDSFINYTLQEMWNSHPWTFARRKTTFATVADQEDYALDEEVDRIMILRQRTSPFKLRYVPDRIFYTINPDPEGTGSGDPRFYRLWEERGFSTNITTTDDTITVVSSSASDGSSFRVIVVGRNTNGLIVAESFTLNGTTAVTSATTFQVNGLMQVSKSASTTGTITVARTTGATVLARLSPEDIAPRFKVLSLYPIPSSAITMYLEYCERLRLLVNDADVPQIDIKWAWLIREGALSKMWEYKQNEQAAVLHRQLFERGLDQMQDEDQANFDYVPSLHRRLPMTRSVVRRTGDSVNDEFPSYSLSL